MLLVVSFWTTFILSQFLIGNIVCPAPGTPPPLSHHPHAHQKASATGPLHNSMPGSPHLPADGAIPPIAAEAEMPLIEGSDTTIMFNTAVTPDQPSLMENSDIDIPDNMSLQFKVEMCLKLLRKTLHELNMGKRPQPADLMTPTHNGPYIPSPIPVFGSGFHSLPHHNLPHPLPGTHNRRFSLPSNFPAPHDIGMPMSLHSGGEGPVTISPDLEKPMMPPTPQPSN